MNHTSLDPRQSPQDSNSNTSPLQTMSQQASVPEYLHGSKTFLSTSVADVRRHPPSQPHPNLTVQSAFLQDLERRRKTRVSFDISQITLHKDNDDADLDNVDYGYNQDMVVPPPAKRRRRMSRRNSKTPQMLLAMNAALVAKLELFQPQNEEEEDDDDTVMLTTIPEEEEVDEGLRIAAQLVQQLQIQSNRRR